MVTLLDFELLNYLLPIFVWAFVFIILFAILEKFKILGEKTPLHSLIAFIFATLFILVKSLRDIIINFAPWLVILFVLMLVILIAVMLLGIKQEDITQYVMDTPSITIFVIVAVIVLFFIAVYQINPGFLGYPSGDGSSLSEFRRVIFHPKVLGVLLVLVIFSFIVKQIGYKK